MLVLMPGNADAQARSCSCARPTRGASTGTGHSLTPAEASAQSGIRDGADREPVRAVHRRGVLAPRQGGHRRGEARRVLRRRWPTAARKLALLLEPQRRRCLRRRDRRASLRASCGIGSSASRVQDATPILGELRQIKTPYEQDVLRKSVAISSEAHKAGMRAARRRASASTRSKRRSKQVYLRNGAMSWGYPSIVGSGPNATILHYQRSSRQMQPGDLLLVDAAANYQGLHGRHHAHLSGRAASSHAAQRDIYEIVLAAQEAGIAAARPATSARDIQAACDEVLRAGLVRLASSPSPTGTQFKIWATHGVSHWIGMDVHDVGVPAAARSPAWRSRSSPASTFARPRSTTCRRRRRTPRSSTRCGPMVQKYKNIGVRIEDSFLLTDGGLERLSSRRAADDRRDRTVLAKKIEVVSTSRAGRR